MERLEMTQFVISSQPSDLGELGLFFSQLLRYDGFERVHVLGTGPVDRNGRPRIAVLPGIDVCVVESSHVLTFHWLTEIKYMQTAPPMWNDPVTCR